MKIVAIEEHFCTPEVGAAWAALDEQLKDDMVGLMDDGEIKARLEDLSDVRLRHMDESGVDVQVLSLTTPGTQSLAPAQAVALARACNDRAAEAIGRHPDRFEAFATLPTPDPERAARELERCVGELGFKGAMLCGRTRDRSFDRAEFEPILAAAASLRVPLYIHPQIPQRAVRAAYYDGFAANLDVTLAGPAWGWHLETGIEALRLILSGAFDRHPDLQILLGHWGEMVVFYFERIKKLSKAAEHLHRPVEDYVRQNFYVSPSGMFFQNYLRNAVEVLGIDRILFSVDYPYEAAADGAARRFLTEAPLSGADREKIAHGNWERLTARR